MEILVVQSIFAAAAAAAAAAVAGEAVLAA
jgi:hypothetical protein